MITTNLVQLANEQCLMRFMQLNDSRFVQDIVTMENIAHNGKLTREKFVELHGEDFALAAERFVKNPFPESQRMNKQLATQERFSDSLISHIP